jgi:hypothetical protein
MFSARQRVNRRRCEKAGSGGRGKEESD